MAKIPPELNGWSIKHIATLCEVSEKTVSRWKAGQTVPPKTALMILRGDLGAFSRDWRGWIIRGGELVSPEGWCITMSDVRATPLQRQQIAIYQAENRGLKAELEARQYDQDQPLPSQWGWDLSGVKVTR